MPTLFPLTCQTCGSNEMLLLDNGIYKCKYCTTNHVLIDGTLKRTQEQNTFFGAAAVFMELGQHDRAIKMFNKILDDSPNQSRAWWGLVICQTNKFTRISITQEEFKEISNNAKCAFSFATPVEQEIIQKQWEKYSAAVKSFYQEQINREKAETQRREAQRKAEEQKKKEQLEAEERTQRERTAKKRQLEDYKEKTRRQMDAKGTKLKAVLLATSISVFLISNIVYCIIVFSQNIPSVIYNSPSCIAPVVIGGFVAMAISGITSGLFNVPAFSCIPAIVNAICVIMMVGGMLSHNNGFFMSAMVIICFGAVGMGVTALLGWLGGLIASSISENSNVFDYAKNKYNNEYNKLVDAKKLELGL